MSSSDIRVLLVPGGGGSGPEHWHHRWAAEDPRCEWVEQNDWDGGTRQDWVGALDRQIHAGDGPVVLVPHSLGNIVVAHWAAAHSAATHSGPVIGALLVAPADIDDDWVKPGSVYEPFRPIPMRPLGFSSVMAVSSNDPLLSIERARELSAAWGSTLRMIGDLLHVGSDAKLASWTQGRTLLDELVADLGDA